MNVALTDDLLSARVQKDGGIMELDVGSYISGVYTYQAAICQLRVTAWSAVTRRLSDGVAA
jgi:hypothetical protein